MLLTEVLQKYSTVDTCEGSDKITTHSYGDLYDAICAPWRQKPDLTILEIGVSGGAFLRVLSEYFQPSARIYGIDVDLSNARFAAGLPNVRVFQRDGCLPETAAELGKQYDLIMEDGSHMPEDQERTLDAFAPYLKEGGIYITEDIHEINAPRLRQSLAGIAGRHGLVMEWHDLRKNKGRFDDIVAVFRRPAQ